MSAEIIPFARDATEAWEAYVALVHQIQANPHLLDDPDHMKRCQRAHATFTALFMREGEPSRKSSARAI